MEKPFQKALRVDGLALPWRLCLFLLEAFWCDYLRGRILQNGGIASNYTCDSKGWLWIFTFQFVPQKGKTVKRSISPTTIAILILNLKLTNDEKKKKNRKKCEAQQKRLYRPTYSFGSKRPLPLIVPLGVPAEKRAEVNGKFVSIKDWIIKGGPRRRKWGFYQFSDANLGKKIKKW